MFERFTSDSRQVLVRAQEHAGRHGAGNLGTEHLLLGLLRNDAVTTLLHLNGPDPDRLRAALLEMTAPVADPTRTKPVFDERAKRVLELALREAIEAEERLIRPRHILLGIVREGDGVAADVLTKAGVTAEGLRTFADMTANVTGRRRGYRERVRDIWDYRASAVALTASPGASRIPLLVREAAGANRVRTLDYLRALLAEGDGLAARILADLGVTPENVAAKAEELSVAGTSDEAPEDRESRQVRIKVGTGRELTIEDEDLAKQLLALASEGDEALRDALRKLTGD